MARFAVPPTNWDEVHAGYAPDVVAKTRRLQEIVVATTRGAACWSR